MKRTLAAISAFLALALGVAASLQAAAPPPPPPPDTLKLSDLANRPDRWPDGVSLPQDVHLKNGSVIHAGDKLRIARFDGTQVGLAAPGNMILGCRPTDCGLLEAANQAWSALTPAQRAITPDVLTADRSLWPTQVTTEEEISCNFGKLPAHTDVTLSGIQAKGPVIVWPKSNNQVALGWGDTDVFARARKLALVDPDQRPSPVVAVLQPLLVDADGKPYQDPHLAGKTIFALYYGASWCPPCREFSPGFVKFLNEQMPKHPELAVVMISNDKDPAQMYGYMKEEHMPFPAVPLAQVDQSRFLLDYAAKLIPHLVVLDRYGKVLATSDDEHGNRFDLNDTVAQLKKILEAQTAKAAQQ